jgi:hypothetical protein
MLRAIMNDIVALHCAISVASMVRTVLASFCPIACVADASQAPTAAGIRAHRELTAPCQAAIILLCSRIFRRCPLKDRS